MEKEDNWGPCINIYINRVLIFYRHKKVKVYVLSLNLFFFLQFVCRELLEALFVLYCKCRSLNNPIFKIRQIGCRVLFWWKSRKYLIICILTDYFWNKFYILFESYWWSIIKEHLIVKIVVVQKCSLERAFINYFIVFKYFVNFCKSALFSQVPGCFIITFCYSAFCTLNMSNDQRKPGNYFTLQYITLSLRNKLYDSFLDKFSLLCMSAINFKCTGLRY